jgi:hypothetical protein
MQGVTKYMSKCCNYNRDENTGNKLGSQFDGELSRGIGALKNETINIVGSYDGNSDENPEKKHDRKLDSNNTDF